MNLLYTLFFLLISFGVSYSIYIKIKKNTSWFIPKKERDQDFKIHTFTVTEPNFDFRDAGEYHHLSIKRSILGISFYTPYYSVKHYFFSSRTSSYEKKIFQNKEYVQLAINNLIKEM